MGSDVWKSEPQHTVLELMAARLETDPDGPYLDVCGTKLTPARSVHGAAAEPGPTRWSSSACSPATGSRR